MATHEPFNLGTYSEPQPFKYWCQKVLPLVYDDSLSYYELLSKVVDYINKLLADDNTLIAEVTALKNWFNNLDVSEEINAKLDEMAENGELYALIEPYLDNLSEYIRTNAEQQQTYNERTREILFEENAKQIVYNRETRTMLQNMVGHPYTANTAEAMTDTEKVYVYTGTTTSSLTNGHWYFYDGTAWADGGVYNSTALETDKTLLVDGAAADARYAGIRLNGITTAFPWVLNVTKYNLLTGESETIESPALHDYANTGKFTCTAFSGIAGFNRTHVDGCAIVLVWNDNTYIGAATSTVWYDTNNTSHTLDTIPYFNTCLVQVYADVWENDYSDSYTDAIRRNSHETDTELKTAGIAADAKKTGDEISGLKSDITTLYPYVTYTEPLSILAVSSLATNGTTGAFVAQGGWKVSYFPISANEFVKLKITLASSISSVCSFSTSVPTNGGSSTIIKYNSSGTEYEIEYTAPSAGYICVSSTNIAVTIHKIGYNLNSVISLMQANSNRIGLFSDLEVSAIIPECYMHDIGTFKVANVSKITIYKKYNYNNQYLCGVVVFNGGTAFAMYNSYLTTTAAENALKAPFWIPPQADYNDFAFQIDWSKLTDGMHTYEVTAHPTVSDINHSPSIRDYSLYQKKIGLYDGINPYAETYDHYKLTHSVPEKTAFGSGNLPSGAHNWATPSCIVTNNGKILVAADARMGTGADSDAQVAYVIKYENADLSDASPTMQVLFSASNTAYTNISFVVDRTGVHGTTGRIFAFALKFASGSYAVNQTSSTLDCVYKYSDNDGDTWSAEVSIKSAWDTTKYNGAGTSPTNGIQTSDGTLILPAMYVAETGIWKSGVIYKKTNGSWTFSSMTPYNMDNECAVYTDSSNNIYLSCRTDTTSDHLYKYNLTNDKWSPEKIDYDNGVAIQRSIIGRQYENVYPFGTPYVLLRTTPDPSSPDNRNFFTIWLSKDGKKWIRLYQFYKGNNGGYGVIDCYNDIAVIAFMGTGGIAVQNVSELVNDTDLISNTLNVIDGSMAFRIQRLRDVLM